MDHFLIKGLAWFFRLVEWNIIHCSIYSHIYSYNCGIFHPTSPIHLTIPSAYFIMSLAMGRGGYNAPANHTEPESLCIDQN